MRQIDFEDLAEVVNEYKYSGINRIFLHWSAGSYTNIEGAYHISIGKEGDVYLMHPLNERLAATWMHNTNSINVSIMCARGATVYDRNHVDLGDNPPTIEQVAAMAKVVAVICKEMGWAIEKPRVMTHGEIADEDGYGVDDDDPEMRWDLLLIPDSDGQLKPGGDVIRGMAIWFQNNPESI